VKGVRAIFVTYLVVVLVGIVYVTAVALMRR
jgi:hypothetical protein